MKTSTSLLGLVKVAVLTLFLMIIALPLQAQRPGQSGDRPDVYEVPCDCRLFEKALALSEANLKEALEAFNTAGGDLAGAEIERDEAAAAVDAIVNGLQDIDGVVADAGDLPEGVPVGRFGLSGYGINATVYFPADQSNSIIGQITAQLEQADVADALEEAQQASQAYDEAADAFEDADNQRGVAEAERDQAREALDLCLEDC